MRSKIITALVASGTVAACTTVSAPQAVQDDFGNSARSLIQAQTANPATLANPSAAPVTGVEPEYANNIVTEFREGVSKPEDVKTPIVMRVGGWSR
jgi:type IV pilus biogenesis protein CpaD/CtpE